MQYGLSLQGRLSFLNATAQHLNSGWSAENLSVGPDHLSKHSKIMVGTEDAG
jgi:hypothetical protein